MQIDNTVVIDIEATPPPPPPQDPTPNRPKTIPRKRKKDANSQLQKLRSPEEKQAHMETLEKELEGLFRYYRVVMSQKVVVDLKQCGGSRNAVVAALMEESELPLSMLVDEIHGKLNSEVANGGIMLAEAVNSALVKSSVLIVGQRMMYGVPNADADILEDHSDSCLWCWEVHPCGQYRKNTVVGILQAEHGLPPVFPIHRLDRLVSGLLIMARNASKADSFRQEVIFI
ncbi:unnamed protein product [Trifolium pratense]|uniref:Uncharacterized protein n=1 Tax=Trifolium pratense TaxID=57577 RepID=A0ACB0L5P0_TRIPR|nr:unnamed protein product [Trifolium pratense]